MKSFLEEYNKCLFSENIFSPNCINSLLGYYLFLGGFFEESGLIFRELNLNIRDYPSFINENLINYFQKIHWREDLC